MGRPEAVTQEGQQKGELTGGGRRQGHTRDGLGRTMARQRQLAAELGDWRDGRREDAGGGGTRRPRS